MGYTGHIKIGNLDYTEWKHNNVEYGLNYAQAYLKTKWATLKDERTIKESLHHIYSLEDEEGYKINALRKFRSQLLEIMGNRYVFDEVNGIYIYPYTLYTIKDKYDNFFKVYIKDGTRNFDPNKVNNQKFMFEGTFIESLTNFNENNKPETYCIKLSMKYSNYNGYPKILDNFIYTNEEIELFENLGHSEIDKFDELVRLLNVHIEKLEKKEKENQKMAEGLRNILTYCLEEMRQTTVKVRLNTQGDKFYVATSNTNIKEFDAINELLLYPLFYHIGLGDLYGDAVIKTKKDLGNFIASFASIKNHNHKIENEAIRLYNIISDDEELNIRIEGSY